MKYWEGTPMESSVRETFGEYVDVSFYGIEWHTDHNTGERSDPWLVWAPPEKILGGDELTHNAVDLVEEHILNRSTFSWSPFLDTGEGEIFTPAPFYGNSVERQNQLQGVIDELKKGVRTTDSSVHPAEIGKLKTLKVETRSKLEDHAGELQEYVLRPLRDALLPSLIESYRERIGFGNWGSCSHSARSFWSTTLRRIRRLWRTRITRGKACEDKHCEKALTGVPEPLAHGAMAALSSLVTRTYVPEIEAKREEKTDRSRDGILDRARPVYFRWIGAQLLVESALYNRDLKKVLDRSLPAARLETRREAMATYDPSPDAEKLLEAIFEQQNEGHELHGADSRAAVYRFVVRKENLLIDSPRDMLARDMKREEVYEELWPEDTVELVEIAQMYHRST